MNIQRPQSKQPMPEHAKKVFSGAIFDVYQWEQEMYDGTKKTFDKLKRADTVVVFPVLPDGRILLTKQEQPLKKPFFAATGGRVEEGEDVLAAAKRELLEESGYEADEFILWHSQQPIGKIDWAVFVFVAKGLRKVADVALDGGEKIEPYPVTFDEFLKVASDDDFNFVEIEIVHKILRAQLDPKKMEELKELFKPL